MKEDGEIDETRATAADAEGRPSSQSHSLCRPLPLPSPSSCLASSVSPVRRPFVSSTSTMSSDSYVSKARVTKAAPSFTSQALLADGTFGTVSLDQYKGKWVVLFFYPLDFTFVCPTEIIAFSDRAAEFRAIGCQSTQTTARTDARAARSHPTQPQPISVPPPRLHLLLSLICLLCVPRLTCVLLSCALLSVQAR